MNNIFRFLEDKTRSKILVAGDALVDEYYFVDASRVSPEFPIPVMRCDTEKPDIAVPGGGGNVCSQFKNFPVDVKFLGYLDGYTQQVMEGAGINTGRSVVLFEGERNPLKRRLYHGQFPLCRWDVEQKNYGLTMERILEFRQLFVEAFQDAEPDVIIFSDYDKGVFAPESIWWDEKHEDTIAIVDPKKGPLSKWNGCDIFKPNKKEAAELSGKTDWRAQCDYFQNSIGCMAVVITQGGEGVVGKVGSRYFDYLPEDNISADSVIGAGDCFAAFLAMGLAKCMDVVEASEMAFEAGKVYVGRRHNQPLTPYELAYAADPVRAKMSVDAEFFSNRDYKLCMTNGVYDLTHTAHLNTLRFAKSQADKLVVAVDSDESVRKLKGDSRPIIPLEQRKKMLAGLECVDYVIDFHTDNLYNLIEQVKPDVLVKASQWHGKIVGSDIVPKVVEAPMIEGISTTDIISRIKVSDVTPPAS